MKKLVVYTALFTDDINYVHGILPEYENIEGVDFICFTNTPYLTSDTWDIKLTKLDGGGRITARKYKTLSHNYLPEYDGWIWMDNSCIFNYNPIDLFNYYIEGYDIAVHEHCDRINIKEEATILIERNLDNTLTIQNQIKDYYNNGYQDQGLYETGILMRKNNNKVIKFNESWWGEIKEKSIRDQLSFPYVMWLEDDVKVNAIKETFVAHNYQLNKKQSKHFHTIPRQRIKLMENNT